MSVERLRPIKQFKWLLEESQQSQFKTWLSESARFYTPGPASVKPSLTDTAPTSASSSSHAVVSVTSVQATKLKLVSGKKKGKDSKAEEPNAKRTMMDKFLGVKRDAAQHAAT